MSDSEPNADAPVLHYAQPTVRPAPVPIVAAALGLLGFPCGCAIFTSRDLVYVWLGIATLAGVLGVIGLIRERIVLDRVLAVLAIVLSLLPWAMEAVDRTVRAGYAYEADLRQCRAQLSQIGAAVYDYRSKNDWHLPPDWDALIAGPSGTGLTPAAFVCPLDDIAKPSGGPLIQGVNSSYAFVADGTAGPANADVLVAYCEPHRQRDDRRTNVLYADGDVSWISLPDSAEEAKLPPRP